MRPSAPWRWAVLPRLRSLHHPRSVVVCVPSPRHHRPPARRQTSVRQRLQHTCGPTGTGVWRRQARLDRWQAERNPPARTAICYQALEASGASHPRSGRVRRRARLTMLRLRHNRGLTCARRQLTFGIAARCDVLHAIGTTTRIAHPPSVRSLAATEVISHGRRIIQTQTWGTMCRT